MDRLLGNPKLQKERLYWFKALIARLARGQRRLVVLVDWTQIRGDFWALVASLPFGGRSIPILAQAYEHDQLGAAEAHLAFLNELRQIVPRDCRAVIIADGGFRSPFFRACEAVGMDFVIRLRNQKSVPMFEWGVRVKFAQLFERATTVAQCFGDGRPYVSSGSSGYIRLVLGPKPAKAHLRKKYKDDYERARATEPWLLATSLGNDAAQSIVQLYAQRMKIEEGFRDVKCPRFGWALKYSGSRSLPRLDALLLIAALAIAVVLLIGAAAEKTGVEKSLRASSQRARQLSLFTVGCYVLSLRIQISFGSVWKQFKRIRRENAALSQR